MQRKTIWMIVGSAVAFGVVWPILSLVSLLWLSSVADAPENHTTTACKRYRELNQMIKRGLYVPPGVLVIAQRRCEQGTRVDGLVGLLPLRATLAVTDREPCGIGTSTASGVKQAGCIGSWILFWRANQDRPPVCIKYLNSTMNGKADAKELRKQEIACQLKEESQQLGRWVTIGAIIVFVIVVASVFGPAPPYNPWLGIQAKQPRIG